MLTICSAKNLQNVGLKKGEMIFLLSNNTFDIVPLVFAALCLGCQISCLPTVCSQSEYEYFMSITNPNYVICDLEFVPILKDYFTNLKRNVPFFTVDGQHEESVEINSLFEQTNEDPYFE